MYFNKKINYNLIVFILFITFLITGLNSFQDFGISLDEDYHRQSGQLYYGFLKEIFSENYNSYYIDEIRKKTQASVLFKMPALFDVVNEFLINFLGIKDSQKVFFFRHLANFLIFLLGCFYFLLLIITVTKNKFFGILGVFFLFFYPRIFGESFYNNKDIIFLSSSIILLYYGIKFLNSLTLKNSILFSVISAIAFDIRIIALLIIFSVYSILFLKTLDNKNYFKNNFRLILVTPISTLFFIIVFWPYLWFDPVNNLIDFFNIIKGATPGVLNHYMGEYIYTKSTPWHYYIIWILITIPLCVTFFFLIGILSITYRFMKMTLNIENKNHKFFETKEDLYDYLFLTIFLVVLLAQIKFGVSYDAWRHLYFLYPLIIIFFLRGLSIISIVITNQKFLRVVYLIIFFELSFLIIWSIKYHPYQYVFFNPVYQKLTLGKFELDYWGVSNRSALEFILNSTRLDNIKVAAISWTSLENTLLILEKKERDRIKIVHDINEADYLIDNYRKKSIRTSYDKIINDKFEKIHDIVIDKKVINSIFKKKT